MTKSQKAIYKTTLSAMLSALAFGLMFIEVPIPALIPSFIKFDISDLPALFGAFALGPVYGVLIELVKNILHIFIKGSSSGYIGELSNFLLGATFCLVAGVIYSLNKNKKTALIACLSGAFIMAAISLPINYYLVYPAYIKICKYPYEAIIGMYQAILGKVAVTPTSNSLFNCLLIFNVPFTFAKGIIDAILCMLIYKPISKFLKSKFD